VGLDGVAWTISKPRRGVSTRMALAEGPIDIPDDPHAKNGDSVTAPLDAEDDTAAWFDRIGQQAGWDANDAPPDIVEGEAEYVR